MTQNHYAQEEPSGDEDSNVILDGASGEIDYSDIGGELGEALRRRQAARNADAPLENDDVPLFQNVDKRSHRWIDHILVTKIIGEGKGFKGKIEASATLDEIGTRWGNGTYNVEACNAKGKVLREKRGLTIEMDVPDGGLAKTNGKRPIAQPIVDPDMPGSPVRDEMLYAFQKAHIDENRRFEKQIDQVYANGLQYTSLVKDTSQAQHESQKLFFQQQQRQTQDFFSAMLQQMNAINSSAMERQMLSHRQTIEQMQAMHAMQLQMTNPATLLNLFRQGFEMAQGIDRDEDQEPWLVAVQEGVKGLGHMKDLAALEQGAVMKQLAMQNAIAKASAPTQPPAQNGDSAKSGQPKAPSNKLLTREEISEIAALKALCDSKGLDFQGLARQAREQLSGMDVTAEGDDEAEDDEGDGTGDATDVGNT